MGPTDGETTSAAVVGAEKLEHGRGAGQNLASTGIEAEPKESSAPESDIQNEEQAREVHGVRWVLVCLSLYIGLFLYGLDTTITADIQGSIIADFGNVEKLAWIGSGYSLGSVAVILVCGVANKNFNLKWLFICGFAIFEVGSLLCGVARDMDMIIVGRVVAGLGGSGIYIGALNIISIQTSDAERGAYVAGFGTVWGAGSVLGPVIGGKFAGSPATWRWAFYINLVFAGICAPIYLFYLPAIHPRPGVTVWKRLKGLDYTGMMLSAGIAVTFTVGLTFGGAVWDWSDRRLITILAVCAVCVILFAVQQALCLLTSPQQRVFPTHLLKSSSQILLYVGTSCAVTNLIVPTYYIPIYFQFVSNDSPIVAAIRLLPFICLLVVANQISGFLLPRIGYYMAVYFVSGIFTSIGGGLMYSVTSQTPTNHTYGYSILIAVGSGLTIQSGYTIATVIVAKEGHKGDTQNVVAFQNVSQVGSTLIALVLSGQIYQSVAFNGLKDVLGAQGFTEMEIRGAVAGAQSYVLQTVGEELRQQAINAIVKAMSRVYILTLTAGLLTICVSVFMKKEKLL